MKALLVVPTYNEKENIKELLDVIWKETKGSSVEVLVVDSASPDGTGELLDELRKKDPRIHVLHQKKKLGLGRAYIDGFQWAIKRQEEYQYVFTMDADFSHHPRYLLPMITILNDYDLVIGSRYVKGGGLMNWPLARRFLSAFANFYAKTIIQLPLNDVTAGFHGFRMELLSKVMNRGIRADGYAFLMELKLFSLFDGARVYEYPIIFNDRTVGDSKISKRVILESIFLTWWLGVRHLSRRLFRKKKRNPITR